MSLKKIIHLIFAICMLTSNTLLSQIGLPPTYYKIPKQTFRHSEMTAGATKTLHVRGNNNLIALCTPPDVAISSQLKKAKLNVQFNWNSDYLASNTTTYNLTYTINAYSTYTGTTGFVTTFTASNLTISNKIPSAYTEIDFTALYDVVNRFTVTASLVTSGGAADPIVNANLFSDVFISEEFEYDVSSAPGTSALYLEPVTITGDNLVKFKWGLTCTGHGTPPNYQFQLLRLYNNSPSYIADERNIRATINWDEALTIETGNASMELSLTIAEGTGYYIWRVRPIGDAYEGGIANDRNWGQWTGTSTLTAGSTNTILTGQSPFLFYFSYNKWDLYAPASVFDFNANPGSTYNVKNDGERNWIFNRSFVEGDENTKGQVSIGEGISYANKLQMAGQKQSRIASEKKKVISQTIYDYSGRAALQTLPTPVAKNTLSYEPLFVKNSAGLPYSAYDFDAAFSATWAPADNHKDPSGIDSVVVPGPVQGPSNYYSSNNQLEENVPTAAGFPFSRTLFSKDGKNTAIESGGPGKEHKLTSSSGKHTTRVMESGVADIEIVRVFGDEAPDEGSVYKTITIDPNNTASVAYISKEGKTIATCLSGSNETNLEALPSASVGAFTSSMNVNASNTSSGPFAFHSFKTLGLIEATNVTLDYGLTPNSYSDLDCYSGCQTCDYLVTLKITDNNAEMAPIVITLTATPSATTCTASPVNTTTTVLLQPGAYTIERIIESNTSPSGSSTTYINSFIQAAHLSLTTTFTAGTGSLVDDLGAPLTGSPTVSMSSFFGHLAAHDLTSLYSLIGAGPSDTHKNIKIGCNTIRVPIWPCSYHTCTGADLDFEAYLFDKIGISPTNTTAKQATLSAMFSGVGYTLGDFNNVIQNMLNAGYSCSALWNCWEATVALYLANNNPALTTGGSVTMPGTSTVFTPGSPNYLDRFLDCAGYQAMVISSTPGSGVCPESSGGYLTHPYKYFKYTTQCCACETAFENSYAACGVTPSTGTTISCAAIGTFTAWFNLVNAIVLPCAATGTDVISNNKEAFYKCLINNSNGSSSPSACSLTSPSSSAAIAAGTASTLINACLSHCEGLYDEFVSQNIDLYHSQGLSVQDDRYDLVMIDGAWYVGTATHTPSSSDVPLHDVYCKASILVNACKSNCQITVQSNGALGYPSQIAAIQNVFSGQFVISAPTSTDPVRCAQGFTQAASPSTPDSIVRMIERILNYKLNSLRASAPVNGMWWNFNAYMNATAPALAPYISSSTHSVLIHPHFSSYFAVVPGVSAGNRVSYFFNKQESTVSSAPINFIHSIPSVASTANFIYSSASNSVVLNIIASPEQSYIFNSGFLPVLGSAVTPGTLITVEDALNDALVNPAPTFTIDTTTTLYSYNHSGNVKGYWVFDITRDITGEYTRCNQTICYKLQPAVVPGGVDVLDFNPPSCEVQTTNDIANAVNSQISSIMDAYEAKLRALYYQNCVTNLLDTYVASYSLNYHHYTLYYYDRAGNLVKTVPPAGVTFTSTNRATDHPDHAFITEYAYNSLGQLVRQKTPDGGETFFLYDAKSKLRFSQNAKQLANNKYSYTKYDPLMRIVEVGEFTTSVAPTAVDANNPLYPSTNRNDITLTVYSTPAAGVNYFYGKPQRFLLNRVSQSTSDRDGNLATLNDQVITYYSYDAHGNVEWLIQDIPELGRNYVAYEYDLVSGSVVKVKYNEAMPDKFFHRYTYDQDKRIASVETSDDNIFWEKDASYSYYLHGPLKRSVIGHDKVQGLDYVYTINGWLKAMNGLNRVADPGGDGALASGNITVPRDAYSMVLGYHSNDYNCRSSLLNSQSPISLSGISLYNGNISSWVSNYDPKSLSSAMMMAAYSNSVTGKTFRYDQLNRIISADFKVKPSLTANWVNMNDYKESFSYDPNGNIINLFRNGQGATLGMDDMTYHYYTQTGSTYIPNLSAPATNTNLTNRLAYVTDAVSAGSYTTDIDAQAANTYSYDAIGNLIADASESITAINWNVYGKITDIVKVKAGVTTTISFLYDASGNRVYKKVANTMFPVTGDVTTYYVKDASGNVMGTYERTNTGTSPNYTAIFSLKEQAIYGSDRLGLNHRNFSRNVNYTSPGSPASQLNPPVVHTSSYPFIMLPLSNTTQKELVNRDIKTEFTTLTMGSNDFTQKVPTASTTVTYQHTRNQAMAHDFTGNVVLSAYTYSVFTAGVWSSNVTVLSLRDKTTYTLTGLNISPNAQSAFLKKAGSESEYYFFTIGTNGKAYYHIVDANSGGLVSTNNELDANSDYGNTMALFEDLTGQGNSTLYLRRYAAGTSSLALFSITETGIQPLPSTSLGTAVSSSNDGEISISPNGNKLAVVTNTSASNSEIKLYNLGVNHQSYTLSASRGFAGTSKSLEFSNNDVSLFFTSAASSTVHLVRLPVATLGSAATVTLHTQPTSTITGSIRKGVNGYIYYVNGLSGTATPTLHMFTNPDVATTSLVTSFSSTLATGNMPIQPHLLAYTTPTTVVLAYNRRLDEKEYELKDHLGNIHATVKDFKIPFSGGSSDVALKEYFNAGNSGGFAATASPAGTIVDNINNKLRVFGTTTGAAAQKIISLPAGAGQYLLSFDYDAGNCSAAQFNITNLTPLDGSTRGGLINSGSYNYIIKVPTGMSSLDLRFEYLDATSNKSFYIDNLIVKKVDEAAAILISNIVNENFSVASDWVATNTLIDYSAANMKIYKDPAATTSTFSAAKSVNLLQGQMYKLTFDVTALSMGTSSLSLAYESDDNTTVSLDFNTPLSNSSTSTYTFYITPSTNQGTILYSIVNPSGSFTCNIDNFKIDHVNPAIQPVYTASLNMITDYYAFGSPMINRSAGGTDYRYGFNGQEKDNEIAGDGNINTAEFWEYDTRLGRRWNTDPEPLSFISDYVTFLNNPILYNDPLGNTVDPTNLNEKDKASLKADLEQKTGYTLKETETELGDKRWEIDKSKGVNKEGTSRLARRELRRAIKSGDNIMLVSSDATAEAQVGSGQFSNRILWNSAGIESAMSGASSGLNPTTVGFALTFFHEIRHTKAFANFNGGEQMSDPEAKDKWIADKSPIDGYTNRIRRQLGAEYGQRQTYFGRRIVTSADVNNGTMYGYLAMDKRSLRDIRKNRIPSGRYIKYNLTGR